MYWVVIHDEDQACVTSALGFRSALQALHALYDLPETRGGTRGGLLRAEDDNALRKLLDGWWTNASVALVHA